MKHFSIRDALRFGWDKTRLHNEVLFQATVALFALQVAGSIVDKVMHDTLEGVLAQIALGVVSIMVGTGFTLISLKVAKGEHATYRDLMPQPRLVWYYFVVSVLTGLLVVLGLIALIIPGIYLLLRFSLARFAVLDGAGIMDSLTVSARLTKGVKWKLLGFLLALIGINILGALALMVGLLITIPVSTVAYAHVYLVLKHRA